MKYWNAALDVAYNFGGPHRPQWCLWAFLALAILTSLDSATRMMSYGHGAGAGWFMFGLGMFLWVTILPSAIFLIDCNSGRVRLRPRK